MALTRSFNLTVIARAVRDSAFAEALIYEADRLFLERDARTARRVLNIGQLVGHTGFKTGRAQLTR
jgi:hypothetical protein